MLHLSLSLEFGYILFIFYHDLIQTRPSLPNVLDELCAEISLWSNNEQKAAHSPRCKNPTGCITMEPMGNVLRYFIIEVNGDF